MFSKSQWPRGLRGGAVSSPAASGAREGSVLSTVRLHVVNCSDSIIDQSPRSFQPQLFVVLVVESLGPTGYARCTGSVSTFILKEEGPSVSVSDLRREGWYLLIFSVLSGVWFTGLIQREVRDDEYNNLLDTILGIGQDMEAAVVVVGATTYVTVEASSMLAEKYLRRRYYEGRQEGLKRAEDRIREMRKSNGVDLDTVDEIIKEIKRIQASRD